MKTDETIQAIEADDYEWPLMEIDSAHYWANTEDTVTQSDRFQVKRAAIALSAHTVALAAELKLYREFVGAMHKVAIEEWNGTTWDDLTFRFFNEDNELVATGTDAFDAYCKMRNERES